MQLSALLEMCTPPKRLHRLLVKVSSVCFAIQNVGRWPSKSKSQYFPGLSLSVGALAFSCETLVL
jgi:hypothetical protein